MEKLNCYPLLQLIYSNKKPVDQIILLVIIKVQ